MNRNPASIAWDGLRAQLQGNARLRLGAWLILGIVWIYGLLVVGDVVTAQAQRAAALVEEVERLRTPTGANPWPARIDEARQHLAALHSMQWAEGGAGDLGLAEAALQDWARGTALKAGVRVREMSLSRSAEAAKGPGAAPSPTAAAQAIKLRMNLEWSAAELTAFLAEIGRYERVVVVERLLLRPATPGGTVEIDLRILAALRAPPAPPTAKPVASR